MLISTPSSTMRGLFTPSSLSLEIKVLDPRIRMDGTAFGLDPALLFSTSTMPGVREARLCIRFVEDTAISWSPLIVVAAPVNVSFVWV